MAAQPADVLIVGAGASGGVVARGLPDDYPLDETSAEISPLMYAAVGASILIYAGAWPYRPTVLADVTTTLPAWTDEIFGPVAPVVAFDSDGEAIALANSSEYGLAAGVYSRSISRGLAIANAIKAGMVHVNDQTINDEAIIPFGGMALSGNGSRFGGEANLEAFTQWQWVTVRDAPKSFPAPY